MKKSVFVCDALLAVNFAVQAAAQAAVPKSTGNSITPDISTSAASGTTSAAENSILFVTEEWAPYNYTESDLLKGFSVDIIREIMIDLGVSYPVEILPGIRAKHLTEERPFTAMFTVFRTPEREQMFKWVGPIDDGSMYFYRRSASTVQIEKLSDAKNVQAVSCRSEGLIPNILREYGFTNLSYSGMESTQVLKKLIYGQAHLAVCDTDTGVRYYLKKMAMPEKILQKTPVCVYSAGLYIAFHKDFPSELISAWQKSLDKLKKTAPSQKFAIGTVNHSDVLKVVSDRFQAASI